MEGRAANSCWNTFIHWVFFKTAFPICCVLVGEWRRRFQRATVGTPNGCIPISSIYLYLACIVLDPFPYVSRVNIKIHSVPPSWDNDNMLCCLSTFFFLVRSIWRMLFYYIILYYIILSVVVTMGWLHCCGNLEKQRREMNSTSNTQYYCSFCALSGTKGTYRPQSLLSMERIRWRLLEIE